MKKAILFLLLITLSFSVYGQEKRKWRGNYLISATIESLATGKAILTYDNITRKGVEKKVIEAGIANGKFAFYEYLEEPALAELQIGDNKYAFYIDPTNMTISIDENNEIKVEGSWTNDDKIKIEQLEERINSLAGNENKKSEGNLAELSYASLVKDSFVVLKKMQEVAEPKHPYHSDVRSKQMINILMSMSDDLKNTPSGVKTSEKLFLLSMKMHNPPKTKTITKVVECPNI